MGLNHKAKGQAMGDSLASQSLLKGVWEINVFELSACNKKSSLIGTICYSGEASIAL